MSTEQNNSENAPQQPPPQSKPKRSSGHKLKLVILWPSAIILALMVFLLVLSIVSYYVLLYPPLQEKILRIAEERLSEYIIGDVTIERFESNLLSYVDLHGIRAVGKSEYRDSAYVGQVTVRYWIPALVRKRFHVTSAMVTDVRGHVVMEEGNNIKLPFLPLYLLDSAGNLIPEIERFGISLQSVADSLGLDSLTPAMLRKYWNDPMFKALPKEMRQTLSGDIPKPTDWAWEVVLGRVQVNGISAVYRDLANEMVGEIKNASATARFHSLDSFSVRLRVPEGSYHSPWWSGTIDTIGASGVVTWTGLHVNSMIFKGEGTHVTGSGRLSYFPDGPWDLETEFITNIKPVPILYEFSPEVGRDGYLEGKGAFRGRLFEPQFSARVTGHGIIYDGFQVPDFYVSAVYGRDEFGRARIRGASELGQFEVNAALEMKDLMTDIEFGGYSFIANMTGIDAKRAADYLKFDLPLPIDGGSARVSAEGIVIGEDFQIPSTIDLTAAFDGEKLAGGGINIKADIKNGNWDFGGSWGENQFEGNGKIDLEKITVSGGLNASLSDLAPLAATFAGERVRGRATVAAEFGGRLDDFEKVTVSADVKGNEVWWQGMFADSIDAQLSYNDGKLRLYRAGGHISGRIDSIASLLEHGTLSGYIDADFTMKGVVDFADSVVFDDVFLNAWLRARHLRYDDYTVDTLFGFVSLKDELLRWNNFYLREKNTSLKSNGSLTLGQSVELTTTVELFNEQADVIKAAGKLDVTGSIKNDYIRANCRATSVPLNLFDPWIPEEHRATGIVSLTGDFSGTIANPAARVNFRLTNPGYSEYSAHSIFGDAILSDSLLVGALLARVNERATAVEVKATLPFLPSSDWKIDETGIRPAFVRARADRLEVNGVDMLKELWEPDVHISGPVTFDAGVTNRGNGWNLDGSLTFPRGTVRYVPENINISDVRASARLRGTLEEPDVEFVVTSGRAEMSPLRLHRSFAKGRTNLHTLTIDSARVVFRDSGFVDLRAHMLYSGVDSLLYGQNFYAQYRVINFPSYFFARFMPAYVLRGGYFNGSGVVYPANGRPHIDGTLTMNGLEVTIPDIYPPMGPINASFKFADSTIEINSASANWGRGMLSAEGQIFWDTTKFYGANLRVKAEDLHFELPEVINVGVRDADLKITGQTDAFIVGGRAALGPTSYVRDLNFIELINQAQIGSNVRRAPDPFLESLRLNIDLDLINNMTVDMNLGTLLADGRVTLGGTAAEPTIMGRIIISDGFVYYLDRKFRIVEGTLFNPDLTVINPTLRIIAELEVLTFSSTNRAEQYTITLSLTGELENPAVRFTADPALSELDILSILTFGEKMGGVGSDMRNRLTSFAAQQALGLGARRLEKFFNLDRISVSGNTPGADGQNDGFTIGVTKRFSPRFNVTLEANTGKLSNQKATAQYRLLPNVFLEGETTSEGESAVNINLRYSR